jgi:hypothetical protein
MNIKTLTGQSEPLAQRLSEEIERYREECAYPNWDGYAAEPLSVETIDATRHFLDALPNALQTPEVYVEPDGEFLLEWANTTNTRAVVFVNQNGRLSYSLTHGAEESVDYNFLPIVSQNLLKFLSTHFSR